MSLKFNIDAAAIAAEFKEVAAQVEKDIQKAVGELAAITHAKVAEQASKELHSSRQSFMDSLGFEEVSEGIWIVSVDEKGLWIEEGIPDNKDMKPDLLKNGAKTSKAGHRYKAIPFSYSQSPSQMSASTQAAIGHLKQELKKANIPFKKIEKNSDGSPKVGKLHELNLGGKKPGKGNTPQFQKLSIYQHMTASGGVKRSMMTFRTVSDGPASSGKWIHPGLEPKKFLDEALSWAEDKWANEILPDILSKYK